MEDDLSKCTHMPIVAYAIIEKRNYHGIKAIPITPLIDMKVLFPMLENTTQLAIVPATTPAELLVSKSNNNFHRRTDYKVHGIMKNNVLYSVGKEV